MTACIRLVFLFLVLWLCNVEVWCEEVEYVLEGQDVTLRCRVSRPVPLDADLYWLGPSPVEGGTDNYAIGERTFDSHHKVTMDRSQGIYDLTISRATYDRNNGLFKCRVKGQTGDIHTSSLNLTVLIKPGSPMVEPSRPTATQGHALRLTCSSKGGSPDPEIFWYREEGGEPLQSVLRPGGGRDEETTSVLTVYPNKEDDGAQFFCEARNRALSPGEKMVTSVTLNVDYYPIVRISPSNPVRVIRGEDVSLKCEVDAKPPVQNVRWMRDGAFVGTSTELLLNNVDIQDAGRFICQADNRLGRPGEAEITVDVLYPPTVSVPPPREVQIGGDAIMVCNVSSNPTPDFVYWTKVGEPSFRQKTEYLRLNKINPSHHGDYVCHAVSIMSPSNGEEITLEGNATTSIRVRHSPGDSFILPQHPVAVEGKSVVLTCGAKPPGYPDTQYRWWRRGSDAITMGENYTIPAASQGHKGEYHCQPFNSLGNGSVATTNLRVFEPPRITEGLKPTGIYPRERTDLRLTCRAQGDPKPQAKWFKDGHQIKQSDGLYTIDVNVSDFVGERGYVVESTLAFEGPERIGSGQRVLRPQDRGQYECVFENEAEKVASSQLVRIRHAPSLAHERARFAYDVGAAQGSLVCRMRAFPEPTFEWTRGQNVLRSSDSGSDDSSVSGFGINQAGNLLEKFSVSTEALGEDLYETTLTVRSIVDDDYGSYTCSGQNQEGNSKTVLYLQPRGLPGPPLNVDITDAGPDFLEVTFDPGFDGGFPKTTNFSIRLEHPRRPGQGSSSQETVVHCGPHTKCHNPRGQSPLSDGLVARTLIDPSGIPVPVRVFADSTGAVVFSLPDTSRETSGNTLQARLELKQGDTPWSQFPGGVDLSRGMGWISVGPLTNDTRVRARFCSPGSLDFCGPYQEARFVSQVPKSVIVAGGTQGSLLTVVLACLGALIGIGFLCVVCYCYRRKKTPGKKTGASPGTNHRTIAGGVPPPPYYTVGLDNKGMEGGSLDPLGDPAMTKGYTQDYGNANSSIPQQHYQNFPPRGGSVNSQDSLWQIKGQPHPDYTMTYPQEYPVHQQDYSAAHLQEYHAQEYPNGHPQDYLPAHHDYPANHYPQEYAPHISPSPHSPAQARHPGTPSGGGYHCPPYTNFDEYPAGNYPYPGEVAAPSYGGGARSPHGFDESLESGISTPTSRNRRVIREIIV